MNIGRESNRMHPSDQSIPSRSPTYCFPCLSVLPGPSLCRPPPRLLPRELLRLWVYSMQRPLHCTALHCTAHSLERKLKGCDLRDGDGGGLAVLACGDEPIALALALALNSPPCAPSASARGRPSEGTLQAPTRAPYIRPWAMVACTPCAPPLQ